MELFHNFAIDREERRIINIVYWRVELFSFFGEGLVERTM